jgi:hypothetical protein
MSYTWRFAQRSATPDHTDAKDQQTQRLSFIASDEAAERKKAVGSIIPAAIVYRATCFILFGSLDSSTLHTLTRTLRSASSCCAIFCSPSFQQHKVGILETQSIQVFAKGAEIPVALRDNIQDQF